MFYLSDGLQNSLQIHCTDLTPSKNQSSVNAVQAKCRPKPASAVGGMCLITVKRLARALHCSSIPLLAKRRPLYCEEKQEKHKKENGKQKEPQGNINEMAYQ